MAIYFFSDIHIQNQKDPLYGSFLRVLRDHPQDGDTIVLNGDIFDLFVGDRPYFLEEYRELIQVLQGCGERGVEIHYLEGNHDFHLRKAFSNVPKMKIHSEVMGLSRNTGGSKKRFHIAHGDLVDSKDYGYRFLRLFFRGPLIRLFVTQAPSSWVKWFGETCSQTSRKSHVATFEDLPLERQEKIRKTFRAYAQRRFREGFDYVVMGHCHDLDEWQTQEGDRTCQYINMGFPPKHGSYLKWDSGDSLIRRISF